MSIKKASGEPTLTRSDVEQIIGREYVETPVFDGEDSEKTATRYETIARRHEILYEQIPVPVLWTHNDPYSSADELRQCVNEDNELLVYASGSQPTHMTLEQNVKGLQSTTTSATSGSASISLLRVSSTSGGTRSSSTRRKPIGFCTPKLSASAVPGDT